MRQLATLVALGITLALLPPTGAKAENSEQQTIKALSAVKPAPEFALQDLDGHTRNLSDFRGQVVAVNFWATWCPPCKREIPALIELQNDYANQNLQVIGIALDNVEAVREYVQEIGINYPILVGDDDAIEVAKQLGNDMGVLPYTVITDQAGNIRFIRYGEVDRETVENEIQKLI